jgi:hypothetical protein
VSFRCAQEERTAQIAGSQLEINPTAPVLATKVSLVTSVSWCYAPTRRTATPTELPMEPEKKVVHACAMRDGKDQNVMKSCALPRMIVLAGATSPVSNPIATANALQDLWVKSVKR